jgi:hypothetical protein
MIACQRARMEADASRYQLRIADIVMRRQRHYDSHQVLATHHLAEEPIYLSDTE